MIKTYIFIIINIFFIILGLYLLKPIYKSFKLNIKNNCYNKGFIIIIIISFIIIFFFYKIYIKI